jgi:hypothetical protein
VPKRLVLGAITALLLAVGAPTASADTWSGKCSFQGDGYFDPPYSYVVENRDYIAEGPGTCTGVLNGQAYSGPGYIFIDGRMKAPMSCGAGITPRGGVPASITFAEDRSNPDSPSVGLLAANVHAVFADAFVVQGAYRGEALGRWIFDVGFGTLTECMPQNGLEHLTFKMELETIRQIYG